MTRYELRCKKCGQVLGHMTYPGSSKDIEIVNSTSIYGEYSEILCPACEVKRLSGDKRSMDATEEDARQDDIINNALTVNPESCRECPFVTDEEKQITKERPQCDLDREIELYKSKVAFYENQNTRGEYNVTVRELKYVIEILEALRSERPQGEWNYFAEEMGGIRMTGECPNCKQRRILDNFCSNCGADLRGNNNGKNSN